MTAVLDEYDQQIANDRDKQRFHLKDKRTVFPSFR